MSSDSNAPRPDRNKGKGRDGQPPAEEESSLSNDRGIQKMSGIWTASIDSLAHDLNADVEESSSLSGRGPGAPRGPLGSARNWKEDFRAQQSSPPPSPDLSEASALDDDPPVVGDDDRRSASNIEADIESGPPSDPGALGDDESALAEGLWPRDSSLDGGSSHGFDLPQKPNSAAPDSIWSDDLPVATPEALPASAETQSALDEATPDEPQEPSPLSGFDDAGDHGAQSWAERERYLDDGSLPPPAEPDSDATYTASDANTWAGMSRDDERRPLRSHLSDDDDDFKPGVHKLSGLWTASIDSVARDLFQQDSLDTGTSLDLGGANPNFGPKSLATRSNDGGYSNNHVFGPGGDEGPIDDPNLHPSNIFAFDDSAAPTQIGLPPILDPNAPPVPIIEPPPVTSFVTALGASHVFAESRDGDPHSLGADAGSSISNSQIDASDSSIASSQYDVSPSVGSIGGSHVFAESRASDVKPVPGYAESPSVSAEMLSDSQLRKMLSQSRLQEPSHVLDPQAKSRKTSDNLKPAGGSINTSHVFGSKLGKGTRVEDKKKSQRRAGSRVKGGGADPNSRSKLLVKVRTINVAGEGSAASTAPPDYELLEVLGEGGMGVVYLARQTAIDRYLAVKMLKPEKAQDAGVRARFLAEATATADLDHPNIVPVHELGRTANGALFYSMKRVQGTPWSQVISTRTLAENLDTLLRMADAVAFAHSRGVIHRDLKPENVMLGEYGEVLVMDWGLAISYLESGKAFRAERTESMAGSPSYMAPEMASEGAHRLGPASDVYLLGATLFELMTGTPPHTGRTLQQCLVAAARNIIVPTEVKGELMDIAMQAMATEPNDRFQTVQEFQSAVRAYEAHSESIKLADKATRLLTQARELGAYDFYAKAVFTFRESVEQWSGNDEARYGLAEATIDYAATAYEKGDLDLAGSLLNPDDPNHVELIAAVQGAAEERIERQRVLKRVTFGAWAMVVGGLVLATIGLFLVNQERAKAQVARDNEAAQRVVAEKSAKEAQEQRDLADKNALRAKEQETLALKNADEAKKNAEEAKKNADEAKKNAEDARAQEAVAKMQEALARESAEQALKAQAAEAAQRQIAEYNAYVATVGLAQASIQKNGFRVAEEKLKEFDGKEQVGWEWGRLMYLCHLENRNFADPAKQPIYSAVFSPDEQLVLVAGFGPARLWDRASGQELGVYGDNVRVACFSPDGKSIAAAIGSKIVLFDRATRKPIGELKGHQGDVRCLVFADDGQRLLAGDATGTAILWNAGKLLGKDAAPEGASDSLILERYAGGHSVPINSVAFGPGGPGPNEKIATAGDEGRVVIRHVVPRANRDGVTVGIRQRPFGGELGHKGPVYAVAFLPNGSQVVSGGADGQILFWSDYELTDQDTPTNQKPDRRFTRDSAVRAISVSRDGRTLVTGGDDNMVELWDVARGQVVSTLRGLGGAALDVQLSRDGDAVLASSVAGECKLWSLREYAETVEYTAAPHSPITSLSYSPDETQFAAGRASGDVHVWAVASRESFVLSEGGQGVVMSIAVSPDGTRAATGAEDGSVRIWDTASGGELLKLAGHAGKVRGLAFSADGAMLASGGGDGVVNCWNVADGQLIKSLVNGQSECFGLAFSPDRTHLAVGLANSAVRLWNIETGLSEKDLTGHGRGAVWRVKYLDAGRLVSTASDSTAAIWNVATGMEEASLRQDYAYVAALDAAGDRIATGALKTVMLYDGAGKKLTEFVHPDTVKSVSLVAGGTKLITTCADNIVRMWNATGGPALWEFRVRGGACLTGAPTPDGRHVIVGEGPWALVVDCETHTPVRRLGRHDGLAEALYRPGRNELISVGRKDGAIKVWDLQSRRLLRRFGAWRPNGAPVALHAASASADGALAAAAGDDGKVRLYSLDTGDVVSTLDLGEPATAVCFSADEQSSVVATGTRGGKVRLWSRVDGRAIAVLNGHTDAIQSIRFSRDGKFVVTAGREGVAFVFPVPALTALPAAGEAELQVEPASRLLGHKGPVQVAVFSPDGLRVVTGGDDHEVKVWNTETGLELLSLEGHASSVDALAFSADGLNLISGSTAGRVLLWPAVPWNNPMPVEPAPSVATAE